VLGPQDVGHRVVVRTFVRVSGEGRPQFSDLLGELLRFDDTGVTIATDTGERTVPADRIVAGKRIPPKPVRRARRHPSGHGDAGDPPGGRDPS
jgi:hypothetical protein